MELTSESYQSQNSKVINQKQKQHASQPLYIYVYKLREKEFFALNHHKLRDEFGGGLQDRMEINNDEQYQIINICNSLCLIGSDNVIGTGFIKLINVCWYGCKVDKHIHQYIHC
jgi:hypothetical protein